MNAPTTRLPRRSGTTRRLLLNPGWFHAISALCLAFIALWMVFFAVEHRRAPCVDALDALLMILTSFLGESPNASWDVSRAGRMIQFFALLIGVAIVGAFIGKIASLFVRNEGRKKMPGNTCDHVVICNWNPRGDRIVRELHAREMTTADTDIVVITDKPLDEPALRATSEAYGKVYFIRSDPTMHEVLRRDARAHLAQSVIILADDDSADPDGKTALIALAITRLEKDLPRKPHIIAEVVNHRKTQHLRDAGVDEWVCSADYGLGLIAQCAVNHHITAVYNELLSHEGDTCELYLVDATRYPAALVGRPFCEVAEVVCRHCDHGDPVILIGLMRGGRVILNPRAETAEKLSAGDSLIVVAYQQPDLSNLAVTPC